MLQYHLIGQRTEGYIVENGQSSRISAARLLKRKINRQNPAALVLNATNAVAAYDVLLRPARS